jgi:hypothetical protein
MMEEILRAFSLRDRRNRGHYLREVLLIAHRMTPEEYDEFAPETDESSSELSDDSLATSSDEDTAADLESE